MLKTELFNMLRDAWMTGAGATLPAGAAENKTKLYYAYLENAKKYAREQVALYIDVYVKEV